jgi:rhamnogalacturonyl hydrolase YesR
MMKSTGNARRLASLLVVLIGCHGITPAQDSARTRAALRAVSHAVIRSATFRFVDGKSPYARPWDAPPGAHLSLESPYNDWRYWNGVLLIGMIRAGEALGDTSLTRFALRDVAFCFDNYTYFKDRYTGQGKWSYPFAQRFITEELDDCGAMGAGVIEVFRRDPRERYRAYIDSVREFITNAEYRLDDRTFVRPFPERWTLWADDLYMSVSFLSRMGELSGDGRIFADAARQVVNFQAHLFDAEKGLMNHCWYSDPGEPGVAFWGRANGWALLAQVDLLDRLPDHDPQRAPLVALLRRHIRGIARYQGAEGLWHQLLDREDSYLETSCTAMFTYAVARAVNRGYIEPRFALIARRGWEGVMSRIGLDGEVSGVCEGTGVGDDLVFYYHRPTPLNDPHGIGAVLLAGAEMMNLIQNEKHLAGLKK